MGKDVLFVCGSDAHGTPIVVNAEAQGTTPKELVAKYHQHFDEVFKGMGVNFDFFGDTDDPACHNRTQEMVEALMGRATSTLRRSSWLTVLSASASCRIDMWKGMPLLWKSARGDECDQGCGRHLEPGEIKNAICKVCGGKAEYRKQIHYFFKLSEFKDFLLKYLETLGGTAQRPKLCNGMGSPGAERLVHNPQHGLGSQVSRAR